MEPLEKSPSDIHPQLRGGQQAGESFHQNTKLPERILLSIIKSRYNVNVNITHICRQVWYLNITTYKNSNLKL